MSHKQPVHINVAPLVDVMLVLLIIFMVTAPMMNTAIPVNLPKTEKSASAAKNDMVVTLTQKGEIFVNDQKIKMDQLIPRIQELTRKDANTVIQLRADKGLSYEKVVEVLGKLVANGYTRVSLIALT